MNAGKLVIIIIITFVVGFLLYRQFPFDYSSNCVPFWQSNFEELNSIDTELDSLESNSSTSSEKRKAELLIRKKEIKDILCKFFDKREVDEMV